MHKDILDISEEKASAILKSTGFRDAEKALKNLRLISGYPLGRLITRIVDLSIESPSPDDALNNLERIALKIPDPTASFLIEEEGMLKALIEICGSSNMLVNYMFKNPALIDNLFVRGWLYKKKGAADFFEELSSSTREIEGPESCAKILRHFRQQEFLRIGARDLLGLSSMIDTTSELTYFADAVLKTALEISLRHLKGIYGTPCRANSSGAQDEAGFIIIGMGKLGGMELNFSSDIDIIYLYSSERGETTGIRGTNRISLHSFFVRLSELITKLIGGITEDGFVFRVDLDLRPEGKKGDLALSLRSAEIYYESWGQIWERAAMTKARPVAGSRQLGIEFQKTIEPFVYRRYLDFTAIEEIKAMKEKIDIGLLRVDRNIADIKLGFGGIREIEFFTQALQLIYGGKDRDVRQRNTLLALDALSTKGFIKSEDADRLVAAYIFLRNLEHRIQIIEGKQQHTIPAEEKELGRIARMMGFKGASGKNAGRELLDRYTGYTEDVHQIYEMLFYRPSRELIKGLPDEILILFSPDIPSERAIERLSTLHFEDPDTAWKRMKVLREGPPFTRLSTKARLQIDKIAPFFFFQAANSPDPDMALEQIERFIYAIGANTVFYSLLAENKRIIEILVNIFSGSSFLSKALIEHPDGVEILFSSELNRQVIEKEELLRELDCLIGSIGDYEEQLDCIRKFSNFHIMRIGINDISSRLDPSKVSQQISLLADVCLHKAYELAMDILVAIYGKPLSARFAIVGLGKLGGEEMSYSSDLDIVFVYTAASDATDGSKSISTHEFFAKLAQRIISILSIPTKAGTAFKVDTRLRPSGSAGPLVCTERALLEYHKQKAQIWERQAMVRARFICGDDRFGRGIIEKLHCIIYQKGITSRDIKELLRIRKKMEMEIARENLYRYNVKTGSGGLVDIEFIVQIMQLRYSRAHPDIATPNTLKGLECLAKHALIAENDYQTLREAYYFYTKIENRLRIVHNRTEGYLIKGSKELASLAKRLGHKRITAHEDLLREYLAMAKRVRSIYLRIISSRDNQKERENHHV